jgi:hypothetical protein
MSFHDGQPTIEIPAPAPTLRPVALRPTRLAPAVLAKVGETFAVGLSMLQRSLSTLGPIAASQQDQLDTALAEIGRLESLGVRIQEFARVLSGEVPLPSERIALARAVRETLDAWSPTSRLVGVTVAASGESCDVEVNAAVLEQLLSLALECALQTGPTVAITAARQGEPARTMLTMRVDRPTQARGNDSVEDFGDLRWTLFALLARAVGLSPQRLAAGRVVTMMLGFPDVPSVVEVDTHERAEGLPRTAAATGRHVLLIEPQELARVTAHDLMSRAGMRIDSAASLQQAREGLQDGAPDIIVTGLPVDDDGVAALLDEVRTVQPRLRVIQLVDDANAFAFSVPGSDSPAQVGRRNMARTLVPAVAQELDAAWAA